MSKCKHYSLGDIDTDYLEDRHQKQKFRVAKRRYEKAHAKQKRMKFIQEYDHYLYPYVIKDRRTLNEYEIVYVPETQKPLFDYGWDDYTHNFYSKVIGYEQIPAHFIKKRKWYHSIPVKPYLKYYDSRESTKLIKRTGQIQIRRCLNRLEELPTNPASYRRIFDLWWIL